MSSDGSRRRTVAEALGYDAKWVAAATALRYADFVVYRTATSENVSSPLMGLALGIYQVRAGPNAGLVGF